MPRDRCQAVRLAFLGLLHRLSASELVKQLVPVADPSHPEMLGVFDPDSAADAIDQASIEVERRGLGEEGPEVALLLDLPLQARLVGASQESASWSKRK